MRWRPPSYKASGRLLLVATNTTPCHTQTAIVNIKPQPTCPKLETSSTESLCIVHISDVELHMTAGFSAHLFEQSAEQAIEDHSIRNICHEELVHA